MTWSSVFNNEVFSIYYTEKCCLFDQCFIYMLLFINIVSLFYFYILIEVIIYYVFAIFIINYNFIIFLFIFLFSFIFISVFVILLQRKLFQLQYF